MCHKVQFFSAIYITRYILYRRYSILVNNSYSVLYSVVLHIDIYVALLAISQNRSALIWFQFKQIGKAYTLGPQ